MSFHDRAAQRETHTGSASLGCEEGVENPGGVACADAIASIFYRDENVVPIGTLRTNGDDAVADKDVPHRLDGISEEIQEHLLHLQVIGVE
jgi:hypothetical protein